MRTKTKNPYLILFLIYPYQQEIPFDMALHATFVITCQEMRIINFGDWNFITQHLEDARHFLHFLGLITESFGILLILRRETKYFHKPIDLYIASTLDTSRVPSYFPAFASSIAARVSAFGSL